MRRKLQLVTGGAVSGVACECVEGATWGATWATPGARAAHRHALRRHRPKAPAVRCAAATAIARATASVRAAAVRRLAATLASAAVRAMVGLARLLQLRGGRRALRAAKPNGLSKRVPVGPHDSRRHEWVLA